MAVASAWRSTNHWFRLEGLRVIELLMNGDLSPGKTQVVPDDPSQYIDVRPLGNMLFWRVRDVDSDAILAVGAYPMWRVVEMLGAI